MNRNEKLLLVALGIAAAILFGALWWAIDITREQRTPVPQERHETQFAPDKNRVSDMELGDVGIYQAKTVFKKVAPTVKTDISNKLIAYAKTQTGKPYVYGSKRYDPASYDCSDFVHFSLLAGLGMDIKALDSRSQWEYVNQHGSRKYYNLAQAQKGDLLFFMAYKGYTAKDYAGIDKSKQIINHVGIYMGNGQMIHAASAPTGVRIQNINNTHLQYRFLRGGQAW